jgi:predicted Zn-dependent protease with MMP-like domain
MKRSEFKRLVREALAEIPEQFCQALENIAVTVEDAPRPHIARQLCLGKRDLLLGLYQGVPLTKRDTGYGNVLPDKITLYQKQIEALYTEPDAIKRAVRRTVVHEIAHYFGIEEKRLRDLGMG